MTPQQIRSLGRIVLVGGLIAAAVIYFTAPADRSAALLGIDIRTNRDRSQLERMGGKGYVMFKDIDEWFATLWQGQRLGYTIGVLSALGFLLCRGIARVHEDHGKSVEVVGGRPAPPNIED